MDLPYRNSPALFAEAHETPAERLVDRLADGMVSAKEQGLLPRVEDLLAEHPELVVEPHATLRLIYEEVCLRQAAGEHIALPELHDRFPQFRQELDMLLECHRLLDLAPLAANFPEVGEDLGEFHLLAELGRGALGRVFLAEQSFLAGRLVVLKVTPCTGREHLSLARLQHTHIVPLYAVREFGARGLRALCMPCAGGTTLDRILRYLADVPPRQRSGADLRRALVEAVADSRLSWPGRGGSWKFLERASYIEAICWIGLCAAEALNHAREQGLVHLDLKPSNLLLTADGQPMLLDFHLAREPVAAGTSATAWLGGTPAYMSPEQRAAWLAVQRGEPASSGVDDRSDVYSLALVLAEALGGGPHGYGEGSPLAGRDLGHLSTGLRDILTRALQPEPAKRYPDASVFAEDLRRHLTDQPLAGVRNRSPVERWAKWRRRRPHTLAMAGLMALFSSAVAALAVFVFSAARQRTAGAEAALESARSHLARREYVEAASDLQRGNRLLGDDLAAGGLAAEIRRGVRQAARGRAALGLHTTAERLCYAYGDDSLPSEALRTLENSCRETWQARDQLLDSGDCTLVPGDEEQLRTDLLDVAVLWADLHTRASGSDGVRNESLKLLADAEALFGTSAILALERQSLGGTTGAPALQAQSVREHYAVGRWLVRNGDYAGAAAELDEAVAGQPQAFWPRFWSGLCSYRQRHYEDAVNSFSVCTALDPVSAECYFNRALANAARGRLERARVDYDRALEIRPGWSVAVLNRGVIYLSQKQFRKAAADFERALELGADPAAVHYNMALVNQAQHDRPSALTNVERAIRLRPDYHEAVQLRGQLLAR
jgi:serine/threonine protein kinase/tetratricopeptide (TPR) repeat protein